MNDLLQDFILPSAYNEHDLIVQVPVLIAGVSPSQNGLFRSWLRDPDKLIIRNVDTVVEWIFPAFFPANRLAWVVEQCPMNQAACLIHPAKPAGSVLPSPPRSMIGNARQIDVVSGCELLHKERRFAKRD